MPDPAGTIPLRERRTLAEEWMDFSRQVIPGTAPAVQVREMKKAFYAGAAMMFARINDLDPDREPTDLDVAYVESLHQETVAFARSLGAGRGDA